jgi:hypothetical protein
VARLVSSGSFSSQLLLIRLLLVLQLVRLLLQQLKQLLRLMLNQLGM